MTINNSKTVTIPQWMLSIIVSVVTVITGIWVASAVLDVKMTRAEKDIQVLQAEKADKDDVDRIYKTLDEIKEDIKVIKQWRDR